MAKERYDNSSIKSLKGADRVRFRPSVIFGSDGLEGCCHSVFEILSNSIDEAREGYGNKIILTRYADMSIEVEDFGRGIPVEYNEKEKEYNWFLLFCEMYSGGKYVKEGGDAAYEFSLGLNGLGLCSTQYASEYMDVTVHSNGNEYTLSFKKGVPVEKKKDDVLKVRPFRAKSGTKIKWKPDREVFTDINIPREYFSQVLKKQAIVNKDLTLVLRWETAKGVFEEEVYYYEKGVEDYIAQSVGEDAFTKTVSWEAERYGKDREDKPEYKVKLGVFFCFSNKVQMLEYYHNSSFLEHGGSPDKAVKNAFVYAIDAYAKQAGKYNKNESKITFQDVQDCLVLVSNSFSTQTSYENQTKKAINNKFVQDAMTELLRHNLEIYFIENKAEADKIADQVLINKRSRENAEKARITLKTKLTTSFDMLNRIEKFIDCRSKDPNERELYIVEGDSAMGACKLARSAEFQAIMPVRGKILNCLKADYSQIFKNEIITNLIRVMGCGVEVNLKAAKDLADFSLERLRFGKIIICTDADVDGFQIRTLILTMIYRLMPTLIEKGFVYIVESPLYEIVHKDKSYFAYSDKEKNDIAAKLGGKCSIHRSKGLGENEPDMMRETTMAPETRKLIKVMPDDAEKTAQIFDMLLGDDLEGRKKHIAEFGGDYIEMADVE